ncbi:hypothetical protein RRG08_023144 [Elysia crispata]|uniref:Uncharacterized protein n=1 Tax=Elysia crispata TaxID=231223 RepID=A0AAE0XMU6_9GAST|nr:hypothetical protein RRG08_023144 [Elysia crispata]
MLSAGAADCDRGWVQSAHLEVLDLDRRTNPPKKDLCWLEEPTGLSRRLSATWWVDYEWESNVDLMSSVVRPLLYPKLFRNDNISNSMKRASYISA